MNGFPIPYHLRPHKSVDRRLFVDLLARYERWRPITNYAYVSMGAYALEDHKLVHRRFGISRLIAFDRDANTVARQQFNKPIGSCRCLISDSGEVVDRINDIVGDGATGVVIWLDYTDPKELGGQIREFQSLLPALADGDVIRITVNAHAPTLGEFKENDDSRMVGARLHEARFDRLRERIGDFLPADARAQHVERREFPRLLARAFGVAAMKIMPAMGTKTFAPLSILSYADGQRMLSITGALVKREQEKKMRSAMDLGSWPFESSSWNSMASLNVPDLTVRERMFLEREIDSPPETIAQGLGFNFGHDINVEKFVEEYRNYYRFYPPLVAADV